MSTPEPQLAPNPHDPLSIVQAFVDWTDDPEVVLGDRVYYNETLGCFCAAGALRMIAGGTLLAHGYVAAPTDPVARSALDKLLDAFLRLHRLTLPEVNDMVSDESRKALIRDQLIAAGTALAQEQSS